jgi:hypothetical protein
MTPIILFAQGDPAKDAMEQGKLYETVGTVLAVVGILCISFGIVWAVVKDRKKARKKR